MPLQQGDDSQMIVLPAAKGHGLNVGINEALHFVAAEPHATFVRVSVIEGKQELAYDSAVLGRLRGGYRIFQLRCCLGTRIELCYLFVKISFGTEFNKWATTRQARESESMPARCCAPATAKILLCAALISCRAAARLELSTPHRE